MATHFRKFSLLCLLACILSSCSSTTASLRDSWQCPAEPGRSKYATILIASMLSRYEDRQQCEEAIAFGLQRRGIDAYTGYEMLPVAGRPTWQLLADAVDTSGVDCVMTIQAIPNESFLRENDAPWMGRVSLYPEHWMPEVFPQWSLYSHYGFTSFNDPPPLGSPQLFVQVNLFDAESKRLIWAAKIEVTAVDPLPAGNAAVASLVIESLAEANLI